MSRKITMPKCPCGTRMEWTNVSVYGILIGCYICPYCGRKITPKNIKEKGDKK